MVTAMFIISSLEEEDEIRNVFLPKYPINYSFISACNTHMGLGEELGPGPM